MNKFGYYDKIIQLIWYLTTKNNTLKGVIRRKEIEKR